MRDARGRYTQGNPGGPGRPPREREESYLKTMQEVVTPEAWRAVVEKALELAKAGDHRARQWLSNYLVEDAAVELQAEDSPSVGIYISQEEARKAGCKVLLPHNHRDRRDFTSMVLKRNIEVVEDDPEKVSPPPQLAPPYRRPPDPAP